MITNLHQAMTAPYAPPPLPKEPNALKFGILSTATINYSALISPAQSHPGVIIDAVASRNLDTARHYAKRYSIFKAYGSYQELLDDPAIDAVYVSLPNALHYGSPFPTPQTRNKTNHSNPQQNGPKKPSSQTNTSWWKNPSPQPPPKPATSSPLPTANKKS